MKIRLGSVLMLGLFVGVATSAAPLARAQQETEHKGPSKYLYVTNVGVKPGMSDAFAKAIEKRNDDLREAKDPSHFLGMVPITGSERTIFLDGFDSFADLQKVHDEMMANAKLQSQRHASEESVGGMLRNEYTSIYRYRKSLSLHTEDVKLENERFMRVLLFHVRPGQEKAFESLAKMEVKALASNTDYHWAVFEKMYGLGSDSTFVVLEPMKSLAHEDTMIANEKNVRKALGDPAMTMIRAVESKSVKSVEADLFAFSPQLSYVSEAWVKASPDFWGKK